jgi:hypothetical protein
MSSCAASCSTFCLEAWSAFVILACSPTASAVQLSLAVACYLEFPSRQILRSARNFAPPSAQARCSSSSGSLRLNCTFSRRPHHPSGGPLSTRPDTRSSFTLSTTTLAPSALKRGRVLSNQLLRREVMLFPSAPRKSPLAPRENTPSPARHLVLLTTTNRNLRH